MTYALDPTKPLPDEIRRVACEQLDDAISQLREADDPFDVRVHETRKRTKEVRALLRLVRKPLGASRTQAQSHRLRDAARRLAPARDAEVARATLATLDRGASDLARLRKTLEAERDSARASVAGAGTADEVAAELADLRQEAEAWPLPSGTWSLIAPGFARTYRRGLWRMREAYADPSDTAMHEWRKRVKDHWYHLRLVSPAFPATLEPLAELAHRLSDVLGDDHDLAVLDSTIDQIEVDLSARARERLERRLTARRDELRTEAWDIGTRLYGPKPKAWSRVLGSWWLAARRVHLDA